MRAPIRAFLVLPLLLASLLAPTATPEPPECSGAVDANCIHYHQGLHINFNTGDMYWFSVMEFCGSYVNTGENHHGEPCYHYPTDDVIREVTAIEVRPPGGTLP